VDDHLASGIHKKENEEEREAKKVSYYRSEEEISMPIYIFYPHKR
jgi:hypothetical protein